MPDQARLSVAAKVGRPATGRLADRQRCGRLLAEIEEDQGDEIAAWARAAPESAERASFYQQELGHRRRAPAARETRRRDEAKLIQGSEPKQISYRSARARTAAPPA